MPDGHLRPPRPELVALLDAIKDHTDDDTPRLVLADWLDEQDDPFDAARAKLIRKDIARAQGTAPPAANMELRVRADLLRRCIAPLGDFATGGDFARGLPHITVHGARVLKPDVPALLASEPFAFVQFVHFVEAGAPRMEAMAALPEFRFVPGVSLHPFSPFGADPAARFFSSPNLTGLRQIEFRSVQPGAVGMEALAKNPALSRLRKLSLHHNKLVDRAVGALAGAKHLTALTHLNLSDNNIGDKGAEALAGSPVLANLRELDLHENPRLTDRGKQVLRDKFGDRVKFGG
ncbi:MAG: TIGR02996 domain-containing protein [Planctomycetes bacterium]|nr:TIGR02996 domain-containing protein [Planctomycetota bacterium]